MAIETLEDWNTRLGYCGCCEMPSCPVPGIECQSLSGTAAEDAFAPYTQPAGDTAEDVPTLYKTKEVVSESIYGGTVDAFLSEVLDPGPTGDSREEMLAASVNPDGGLTYTTDISHYWDGTAETCTAGVAFVSFPWPTGGDFALQSDTPVCNATSHVQETAYLATYGSAHSLQGCPGPFPDSGYDYYWNITKTDREGFELKNPFTKADLRGDAVADIATSWPEIPESAYCTAAFETNWPKIEDLTPWPSCDDGPPEVSVSAQVRKARYRWAVPADWAGSYFKITWDIAFFPTGWDDPENPEPPAPSFIEEDLTFEWTGATERKSDWFDIAVPAEPGIAERVNVRFICYRGPYGSKPQVTGKSWTPPPP